MKNVLSEKQKHRFDILLQTADGIASMSGMYNFQDGDLHAVEKDRAMTLLHPVWSAVTLQT